MIGVIGGMGPYAGLDLIKKIFDLSTAASDQEHIPLMMISCPHLIGDRTNFLLGKSQINPGTAIAEISRRLIMQGASIIGMPCNTAHSKVILNEIIKNIPKNIFFINMVEKTVKYINKNYPKIERIGVLATEGTIKTKTYEQPLMKIGLKQVILTDNQQKQFINESIYNSQFGIKTFSNPIKLKAKQNLEKGMGILIKKGAEIIILACTEIPIAIKYSSYQSIPLIDSTTILAKTLLSKYYQGLIHNTQK